MSFMALNDVLSNQAPWHFLYFLLEPQKQGSLRPIFSTALTGRAVGAMPGPSSDPSSRALKFREGANRGSGAGAIAGVAVGPSNSGFSAFAWVNTERALNGAGAASEPSAARCTLNKYSMVCSRMRLII